MSQTLGILRNFMFACSSVLLPFLELHLEHAVTYQFRHGHRTSKTLQLLIFPSA
jgi:hypothetical protein